jgi:hypothetical protein
MKKRFGRDWETTTTVGTGGFSEGKGEKDSNEVGGLYI